MKVNLQYGTAVLPVDIDAPHVTVLKPQFVEGLPHEAESFREAVGAPINAAPLKTLIKADDRVAIVIPDITRPLPSDKLLPWLMEELAHVPKSNFTIINGTGSHRVNTPQELMRMVGPGSSRITESLTTMHMIAQRSLWLAKVLRRRCLPQ
ncbi:MAG: lactate racemase domain-containing protein [Pyrinomonadaceae bacterium]